MDEKAVMQSKKIEKLCALIRSKVAEKKDIKNTVKTSIQLGYKPCPVIACSIDAGGDLKQILAGAVEAGVSSAVISRCAVDAGVEARTVAGILNSLPSPDICYLEPETLVLPVAPQPIIVSPSGF